MSTYLVHIGFHGSVLNDPTKILQAEIDPRAITCFLLMKSNQLHWTQKFHESHASLVVLLQTIRMCPVPIQPNGELKTKSQYGRFEMLISRDTSRARFK